MECIQIDRNYKDLKEIKRLYNHSFPSDERIEFYRLVRMLNENRKMYVYLEEEKIVGFTYFFFYEDIAYMGYICVEEELRNRGYGTVILERVIDDFKGYRIAVDIEEASEDFDNFEERKRRRDFYIRNGFVSTDIFYSFFNVDYEILSCGGIISRKQWQDLVKEHWGRFAKIAKYR